jgi:PleD family two-component response regulator
MLPAALLLGVDAFPAHSASGDEVVRRADQALYLAKARGRNQVVAWEVAKTVGTRR